MTENKKFEEVFADDDIEEIQEDTDERESKTEKQSDEAFLKPPGLAVAQQQMKPQVKIITDLDKPVDLDDDKNTKIEEPLPDQSAVVSLD